MAVATPGAPAAELEGRALIEALHEGGYNIYFSAAAMQATLDELSAAVAPEAMPSC